jgi:hypothetical protein
VVIDSSQPSPSELSRQYTAELERTGRISTQQQQQQQQQRVSITPTQQTNQFAAIRTETVRTDSEQRTGGNFEFIGPEAIQDTGARTQTVTVTQDQPQQQFVVVRVPAGQTAPEGAVPVGQFVANRQAAASVQRPFFSEFGARRQASASARSGLKI